MSEYASWKPPTCFRKAANSSRASNRCRRSRLSSRTDAARLRTRAAVSSPKSCSSTMPREVISIIWVSAVPCQLNHRDSFGGAVRCVKECKRLGRAKIMSLRKSTECTGKLRSSPTRSHQRRTAGEEPSAVARNVANFDAFSSHQRPEPNGLELRDQR